MTRSCVSIRSYFGGDICRCTDGRLAVRESSDREVWREGDVERSLAGSELARASSLDDCCPDQQG